MVDKIKDTVAAIKLTDDNDILGFFLGESPAQEGIESSIILYRPIYIIQKNHIFNEVPVTSYLTSMYFRYGSHVVHIPYSKIVTHDEASEFFSMFYKRSIGDLIAREENVHASYIKFFDKQDTKDLMSDTDSLLIPSTSEFLQ